MSTAEVHGKSYCPDCGPAEVPHWVERLSSRIDPIMRVATKPMQMIWLGIRPAFYFLRIEAATPLIYRALAFLKLGRILDAPDEVDNWRTRVIWEEASRRGIVMKEFRLFNLPRDFFWSTYNGDTMVFDGLPRPRNASEDAISWMDDKGILMTKFSAAGIPVPKGKACKTFEEAEAVFRSVNADAGASVIVKPHLGSRSRHTYVGIKDIASLRHAFFKAKELSYTPVVQQELAGFVFRVTLVDEKIAGVMRREPPHVIGDGMHTVQQLIDIENKNPLRHGPIFHELEVGVPRLDLSAVPPKGHMVILHDKVSRSFGASTTEFADNEIHPDNKEMFLKIAHLLDDPLVGVDFMIDDMGKSWREQKRCGVIECNSLPFIDLHHYPLKGEAKNVAALVWDMVYGPAKKA